MPKVKKVGPKTLNKNKNKNKVNVVVNVNSNNKKKTSNNKTGGKSASSVQPSVHHIYVGAFEGKNHPSMAKITGREPNKNNELVLNPPQNVPPEPLKPQVTPQPPQPNPVKPEAWTDPNVRLQSYRQRAQNIMSSPSNFGAPSHGLVPSTNPFKHEAETSVGTPSHGVVNFQGFQSPSQNSSSRSVDDSFYHGMGLAHPETPSGSEQIAGVQRMFNLRPRGEANKIPDFGSRNFRV